MKLILVRHTKVNVPRDMCYGQTDVDVTSGFETEALEIQKQLAAIPFDKLFTSPLQRCVKLAKVIRRTEKFEKDKRLMELHFGDWEQQLWDNIYGDVHAKNWFDNYITARCPNGESFMDVIARVSNFLEELNEKFEHKTVCIITHGGVIRAFQSILQNVEPHDTFNKRISYGELFQMEYE